MKFEVTAIDEITGIVEMLYIAAASLDAAVHMVESDPRHAYEIIEVERL